MVIFYRIHQFGIHLIIGIIGWIVEAFPRKVATIHTPGIGFYFGRDIQCIIGNIRIHQRSIGIEIVINRSSGKCFISRRHNFVSVRSLVSIKIGSTDKCRTRIFYFIGGDVTKIAPRLNKNVLVRFNHTTIFSGEGAISRSIRSLPRRHHRPIHGTEIIPFNKDTRSHCCSDSVFRITVIIVVIYMHCHRPDTWMTRIGMVEPIVMVGYIIGPGFRFHTAKRHFPRIPEMYIRKCSVLGIVFHIERSIAFCLIAGTTGLTIKYITIMHPDFISPFDRNAVIIEKHKSQIPDFDIIGTNNSKAEMGYRCIIADPF